MPATAATTLATALGVLPAYLLGGLALLVAGDLGFGVAQVGVAVAGFFLASALSSVPAGLVSERLGPGRTLTLAVIGSGLSLVGAGLLARSFWQLGVALAIGGLANSLAQPATNLLLLRHGDPRRQGITFGIKQSAGSLATLWAGVSLPVVATQLGWRAAFVLTGALLLPAYLLVARRLTAPVAPPPVGPGTASPAPVREAALWGVALADGLAMASLTSLSTYYVAGSVASGISTGAAGVLLAVGGLVSVVARLVVGWVVDAHHRPTLAPCAALMALGALGVGVLSWPLPLPAHAVATAVAFGLGWGWPGLLHLAVVTTHARSPGTATGVVMVGLFAGGIVGPPAFGLVAGQLGFAAAWRGAGVVLAAAGCTLALVSRSLDRVPAAHAAAPTEGAPS